MVHSLRITGIIALAATAACSTDPIAPNHTVSVSAKGDVSAASTNNVLVTESDITRQLEDTPPTNNWVFYYRLLPTSTGAFVTGPGDPPLGVGSFQMSTLTVADKTTLFNYDHIGTRLADVTALSYQTYRDPSSDPGVALPSVNIEVDKSGPPYVLGDYLSLVFEPYLTYPNGIQSSTWQPWNAIAGKWWATRDIVIDGTPCARQVCTFTWAQFVAAYPNATILGGFGVNQGSANIRLLAATDALTIGHNGSTWTYNFEPFRSPSTKDDCKKGGWQDLKEANGSQFKNQGQCIKYARENWGET